MKRALGLSGSLFVLGLVGSSCNDPQSPAATRDAAKADTATLSDTPAVDAAAAAVDAPTVDTAPADPFACASPDACAWIEAYQRELVGRLVGERPLADGARLGRRATATERRAAAAYLQTELAAAGLTVTEHTFSTGTNLRGRLPATEGAPPSAPLLVVGAHYDSVMAGPGAADDGTGVAIVSSTARYLSRLARRDHPVEFVLFDQEELGLVGSAAYVNTLRTEGVTVDSAHCFDMVSFDGDGDRAVELWSPSAGLAALYTLHATPRGIPIGPVTFTRSDHQSFLARGMPAVGVGEEFVANDHTPHYHRATDTFDRIDFGYLASVTRLAMDVLADRVTD